MSLYDRVLTEVKSSNKALTKAEAETIRVVLDSGGDVYQTQGRLSNAAWSAQKVTLQRLVDRGYLEGIVGVSPGPYRPSKDIKKSVNLTPYYIFVKAAGIKALNDYEAKHGEAKRAKPNRNYPSLPYDGPR